MVLGTSRLGAQGRSYECLKSIRFDWRSEKIALAKRAIHDPEGIPLSFCLDSFCNDIEPQFSANLDNGADEDSLGSALRQLADEGRVNLDFGQRISVDIAKGRISNPKSSTESPTLSSRN